MKHGFAFLILITTFLCGCATQSPRMQEANPPKQAKRVKVLMYDSTVWPKQAHIDIFDNERSVQSPYKKIALLTCEGAVHEEPEMTEAIIYRARMLGANAVILMPERLLGQNRFGSVRTIFRGMGIRYEALDNR